MKSVAAKLILVVIAIGLTGTVANGQARRLTGPEIDRLLRERTAPGQTQRETERARRLRILLGRKVTYREVLKDPDNVSLNLAYARTQIREGNVKDAAATLERILLIAPRSIAVRVLYAIVLFRLDNRGEAERELRTVLRFKLAPALRVELQSYLAEIKKRNKQTRFALILHTGGQYETNRNAAPTGNVIEGIGGLVPLQGEEQRIGDFAGRALISLGVEHDLRFQRRHRLIGAIAFSNSEQARLDRLTLRAVDINGGVVLDLAPVELYLVAYGSFFQLSHEPYLVIGAGEIRPEWRIDRFNTLVGSVRVDYQNFSELAETFDQRLRTGLELRAGAEWRHVLTTQTRLALGTAVVRKLARSRFHQYYGYTGYVNFKWFVKNGAVVSTSLAYLHTKYDQANTIESLTTRRQDYMIAGIGIAIPITTIIPQISLKKSFRNITISTGVEYERSFSNVVNYKFSNWRFTFGITKSFSTRISSVS
jgi:hypothetical protein